MVSKACTCLPVIVLSAGLMYGCYLCLLLRSSAATLDKECTLVQ